MKIEMCWSCHYSEFVIYRLSCTELISSVIFSSGTSTIQITKRIFTRRLLDIFFYRQRILSDYFLQNDFISLCLFVCVFFFHFSELKFCIAHIWTKKKKFALNWIQIRKWNAAMFVSGLRIISPKGKKCPKNTHLHFKVSSEKMTFVHKRQRPVRNLSCLQQWMLNAGRF